MTLLTEGITGRRRRVLLAIASRIDFEQGASVSEQALLTESAFDEQTFRRLAAELETDGWIRRGLAGYSLTAKIREASHA